MCMLSCNSLVCYMDQTVTINSKKAFSWPLCSVFVVQQEATLPHIMKNYYHINITTRKLVRKVISKLTQYLS